MAKISIEGQLRRQLVLSLILLGALIIIPMHFGIRYVVETLAASRMEHDSASLIAALEYSPQSGWSLNQERTPPIYQRVGSGHYFTLLHQDFTLESRSLWDRRMPISPIAVGETELDSQTEVTGERWLIYKHGFEKRGQNFTLWVAEDISGVVRFQQNLELGTLTLTLFLVGLGGLLQRRVLRRAFAQLDPVTESLSKGELSTDLNLPGSAPEEILPLVKAIQSAVKRSSDQISRSRTALGNLAHELKRPLQQLGWLAESAQDPELRDSLSQIAEQIGHLTERELRRARISGAPMPGKLFRTADDLRDLLRVFERLAPAHMRIETEVVDATLPFDRDDMIELLGNLIDNAVCYGRSLVRIGIRASDTGWEFRIEDDGQGVNEAQIEQLSIRGVRLDENAAANGSGLGIAISQAVVQSYSGELQFSRSSLGGLSVLCRLPSPAI